MNKETTDLVERLFATSQSMDKSFMCSAFTNLNNVEKAILASAFKFAGCAEIPTLIPSGIEHPVEESVRLWLCGLMLRRFSISSDEFQWSSWLIEQFWDSALNIPFAQISDAFKAILKAFHEFGSDLTFNTSEFIRAITYNGKIRNMRKFRRFYQMDDFVWIKENSRYPISTIDAYLLLHVIPNNWYPESLVAIVRSLAYTPFLEYALSLLIDELADSYARIFLVTWLNQETDTACRATIQRFLNSPEK